jgi:NADH dehydrogenase
MAAIGRRREVMQRGRLHSTGVFAWLAWLLVHIYFLSGFRSRRFVLMKWGWSYLTFARGSRLIQSQGWRSYPTPHDLLQADSEPPALPWAARAPSGVRDLEEDARRPRRGAPAPFSP